MDIGRAGEERFGRSLVRNSMGPLAVLCVGIAGFYAFPEDLAFLTRLVGICLLVLSLDLITGYCGVATLGQAVLFGVGAYAAGNACLAGWTDPLVLLGIGGLTGAAAGLASGAVIVRFRGLPQLVQSIAIGQLMAALANKLAGWTGGSDGLAGIEPSPLFGIFAFDMFSRTGYLLSVAVLALALLFLSALVRSPFGATCRAIRDDDLRAKMIGIAVYPRLVVMYGVAGMVAGVGGALTALTTGVVGLDSISFERSAQALVMLTLGGAGTLWGALLGAILFQTVEHFVSAINPFHWITAIGLMLVGIVLFFPKGLGVGLVEAVARLRPASRS